MVLAYFPRVLGQVPCSCLAEEIATPGPGQIKVLINVAANPVISVPDSQKLEDALPQLEAFIALDNYLNETSRHAHVILPGPSALEQPHFDQLYQAYSVRTVSRWSDAVFERPAGMPADWETVLTLQGLLLGIPLADLDIDYDRVDRGILYFYRSQGRLESGIEHMQILARNGQKIEVLDPRQVLKLEPSLAQAGDTQIELVCQHDDSPSCYRDLVPAGATGFHHVAVIAGDYDEAVGRYEALGHEIASSGVFGDLRFCYVDTSAVLGHMVEIVEDKPSIRAFFGAVRKAAENWDGRTDLIREMG